MAIRMEIRVRDCVEVLVVECDRYTTDGHLVKFLTGYGDESKIVAAIPKEQLVWFRVLKPTTQTAKDIEVRKVVSGGGVVFISVKRIVNSDGSISYFDSDTDELLSDGVRVYAKVLG